MRFPGRLVLGAAMAAAAVAGPLAVSTHAMPSTAMAASGIPPGGVPFTVQETASGESLCLTRPASFAGQSARPLSFRPCSPLDPSPNQEWRQPRTGPDGFGEILDARGDCAGPRGLLYQAGGQVCQATALNVQWTQLASGTVVDEEPPAPGNAPLYWDEPGPGSQFPRLETTPDAALAATFTFTALPAGMLRGVTG